MKELPSINATYQRVSDLIRQSFIVLLPITLLFCAGQYLINRFIPLEHTISLMGMLNIALQVSLFGFFFCLIMMVLYQYYFRLPLNFTEIVRLSFMRMGVFLLSLFMLLSPMILGAILLYGIYLLLKSVSFLQTIVNIEYGLMILIVMTNIIGFIYGAVSGVFIVNQGIQAVPGIKQSYELIKDYWVGTFLLWAVLGVIIWILSWLFTMLTGNGVISQAMVSFFVLPLWPALMVVHAYHLQEAHRG